MDVNEHDPLKGHSGDLLLDMLAEGSGEEVCEILGVETEAEARVLIAEFW